MIKLRIDTDVDSICDCLKVARLESQQMLACVWQIIADLYNQGRFHYGSVAKYYVKVHLCFFTLTFRYLIIFLIVLFVPFLWWIWKSLAGRCEPGSVRRCWLKSVTDRLFSLYHSDMGVQLINQPRLLCLLILLLFSVFNNFSDHLVFTVKRFMYHSIFITLLWHCWLCNMSI